jgi:hypothetical protein
MLSRQEPPMPLPRDPSPHHAWLLRCWHDRQPTPDQPGVWRFSLENIHTGARLGFPSLAALMIFVTRELSEETAPANHPGEEE